MMRPYLKLFLIGAVVGTLLDGLSTWQGIAYYPAPFLFQTAWWVPFLFGSAILLIGWSHAKLHPFTEQLRFRFFVSLLFLLGAFGTAIFFKVDSISKSIVALLLYFLSWGLADRTKFSFLLATFTALIGCATESLLGLLGLYHYTHPDFFGIPYWLFFLYLHVSAATGYLGRLVFNGHL